MDWIRTLLSRCAALGGGKKLDADLDEELGAHIELAIAENLRNGMSAAEARSEALRAFGGVTQTREAYRVRRGLPWFAEIGRDLQFGFRQLRKAPGFAVTAILTLALGIGANVAIFSIVNGVLLNPLPFPQANELVALHESKPNFENGSISYPNFLDWRRENRSFSGMALARHYGFSMSGRGDAVQVDANFVSSNFFGVLGVRPLAGREFTEAEVQIGAAPVAMISEGLWRKKFNGDAKILGRPIRLDGVDFTIVGVIPARFHLNIPGFQDSDVYAPITQWHNTALMQRGAGLAFHGIARLKPGVTVEQARADMARVTNALAVAFPDTDKAVGASMVPLKEQIVGDARAFLLVLLGAVGFVLLIACVNVASLLLARSAARSREFAVRAALGANRSRIVRQLVTESMLLGVAGSAIGLIPAVFGMQAALKLLPEALPRANDIGLDARVLIFTVVITLLTATLFGLAPALKGWKAAPQTSLKDDGRTSSGIHHRALSTFVVIEMAVALVLLMGAGLMIRSLVRLWNVDPGFNPQNVLNFGVSMPPSLTAESPERIRAAFRDLENKFGNAPGMSGASLTWGAVPMYSDDEDLFWIDGQPKPANDGDMSWAIHYVVGPDYLNVMGIPLKRGRFFTAQDDKRGAAVAVVDDAFARKYFPNEDAIGKRLHVSIEGRVVEIVGIVGHVRQWGLDLDDTNPLRAQIYFPCMQMPDAFVAGGGSGTYMLVRYKGSAAEAMDAVHRANKQMSVEQVIFGEQTMEKVVADSMASRRFAMILLIAFAGLAVALACIGIYGVMAYLVTQRTQELGIRMALGAQRRDVLGLVFTRGAKLTLAGIAIGLVAGLALARLMDSLLYGVSSTDPLTLSAVALLLMLVAMAACYLPAMRAASIDPMRALRTE
jgi:predicted permease